MNEVKYAIVKVDIIYGDVERALVFPAGDLKRPSVVELIQKILTTPGDYEIYMIPAECDEWDAANWSLINEICTYERPESK